MPLISQGNATLMAWAIVLLAGMYLLRSKVEGYDGQYPTFASIDGKVIKVTPPTRQSYTPEYTIQFKAYTPDAKVMGGSRLIMKTHKLQMPLVFPTEKLGPSGMTTKTIGRIPGLKVGSAVMVHVLKKSSNDMSDKVLGVSSKPVSSNHFDYRLAEFEPISFGTLNRITL